MLMVGLSVSCAFPVQSISQNEAALAKRDTVKATVEIHSEQQAIFVGLEIDEDLVERVEVLHDQPAKFRQALPRDAPFILTAVASTTRLKTEMVPYQTLVPQTTTEYCGTDMNGMARYCPRTRLVSRTQYRTQVVPQTSVYCETSAEFDIRERQAKHLRVVFSEAGRCRIEEVSEQN